ncbi:hypothetical protein ACIQUW_02455 [Streptomyces sp. NPDC101117]|uniref:hypothetical protein n=1 Tax=Streptomyces sp. NPDC101117 TaxID=3366108 RepID=UPI003824B6FA
METRAHRLLTDEAGRLTRVAVRGADGEPGAVRTNRELLLYAGAGALGRSERYPEFLRVCHDASARSNLPDHRPDAPDAHLPAE